MMEENNKNKNSEENFSDDPIENLRIENEIQKLKMQAETGASFSGSNDLPPEVENEFLQHVQQFEDAWKNVKYVKLYDLIGQPGYKKEDVLTEEEVKYELKRLLDLLEQHNINLDVLGNYDDRIIYRFITDAFFEHETDDLQIPGMTKNFIYEEFHPNHKMDINDRAIEFIQHWFDKSFNEFCWELGDDFILPDGISIKKEEMLHKFHAVLSCFTSFSDQQFSINYISFELPDEKKPGMGHAEGSITYNAVLENSETVVIEGPFKFYMSNEYGFWKIFYFIFPGFHW